MRRRFHPRHHHPRRGFIIVAVVLIVAGVLLVATSLIFSAQADVTAGVVAARQAQGRALAWSGVEILLNRLDTQRDVLLAGEQPDVDPSFVIYESGGRIGVVRLLPHGSAGEYLVAEASKLDLNRADAAMLEATGLIDSIVAGNIVSYRRRTPFSSVAELLNVDGIDAELLYGPIDEITLGQDEEGLGDRIGARLAAPSDSRLADFVTVYSHEPALQRSGVLRINLNVPWSDELGERINERFGAGAAQSLEEIMTSGTSFTSENVIYRTLNRIGAAPDGWPDIIDALCTDDSGYHVGRVNLNTASSAVLRCLPEFTEEMAGDIVDHRETIGADERGTIAWPAMAEIIPAEWYEAHADWLTTRAWTYRVRLIAGEVDADDEDGPIENGVVYEVVLDLSEPKARVAYLRDLTLLETALQLAVVVPAEVEPEEALPPDDSWMDLPDDYGLLETNQVAQDDEGDEQDDQDDQHDQDDQETQRDPATSMADGGAAGASTGSASGQRAPIGRFRGR